MSRIVADTRGRKSGPSTAIARSQYGAVLRPLEGQVLYLGKNLDIADHTCYDAGEVAEELGATVVRRWRKDVTHVIVAREDYCRGTATVFSAIKARIPIVRALWLVEWLQKSVALNRHEWETVLDEEERLEAARESYLAAQRKHDTTESSDQSSTPGRADDAHDGSLGPRRAKRGGNNGKREEKLKKNDAVVVAADEHFEDGGFKVYVDPKSGAMYDATLNHTNAGKNNNKYYIMQLLHKPETNDFCTWTRWGRVGHVGGMARLGDGTLEDAMKLFQSKFRKKSGLSWENRAKDPVPERYVLMERRIDGGGGGEDEDADNSPTDVERACGVEPECTLEAPVRDLMEMIFNEDNMKVTMANLNYNVNKHPLGELTPDTIKLGYKHLKALSPLVRDETRARRKHGLAYPEVVERMSNTYYSLIPHDFGIEEPPIIDNAVILQREIQLLESLSGMKSAEELMKASQIGRKHHLDRKFESLHLKEMTPLPRETQEFKLLEQYLCGTVGSTHSYKYDVVDIFRIEREGESERFRRFAPEKSFRRLLWHGSLSTNYAGILSQGLRIAPREAPASAYMFGKGIYLADMSSVSAGYCFPNISNGEGLLLLCATELGHPVLTLGPATPNAAQMVKDDDCHSAAGVGRERPQEWIDCKVVHENLRGVSMPDPSAREFDTGDISQYLRYTEYVCYDVSQVLLRYLFRVKMNTGDI